MTPKNTFHVYYRHELYMGIFHSRFNGHFPLGGQLIIYIIYIRLFLLESGQFFLVTQAPSLLLKFLSWKIFLYKYVW